MRLKSYLGTIVQKTSLYPYARQLYKRLDAERSFSPKNKDNLGQILTFQNIPVVPYESLLERFSGLSIHQGGPIWPEWSAQVDARHCRNLAPVDDRPSQPESITETIEDPAVWGGAICNHFGHQVADFSTRIAHAKSLHPNAQFLFAARSADNIQTLAQAPAFFRALLDWHGLSKSQIKIISQSVLAKHLLVAPQAEQLSNYGPSQDYLDLMDEQASQKLTPGPRQELAYVSRAGVPSHFAGEEYVESLMRKVGIKIIRPETLPLAEQLSEYMASDRLIFSEGSALHALQLLGRIPAEVQIINRRKRGRLAKNMVEARAARLTYIDPVQSSLHGFTPSGLINDWDAVTVHHEDQLVSYLNSIDPQLKQQWNHASYVEQRDRDIITWIKRETQPGKALSFPTAKKILKQLKRSDLSHLILTVEQYL